MRPRSLVLALLCCVSFSLFSQTIFIEEDFSAGMLPAGWTRSSASLPSAGWEFGTALGSSGFDIPSFDGGYAACNDDLHDNAAGTGNLATSDVLMSPVLGLAGASMVILEFDYYAETDASGSSKVQSSIDGGATWSFTFFLSETGSWRHFYFALPSFGANSRIRFVYEDGGVRAKGVAIDNIRLYEPAPLEGEIERPFTSGQMPQFGGRVGGKFRSLGTDTIHTLGLAYSIDGGSPVAGTITGLSVAKNVYIPFSHPASVSFPSTGLHDLKLWLTDLNGAGPDSSPHNDTVSWTVEVLPDMPDRHPLVEDCTGAWCTFCADGSLRHQQVLEAYPEASGLAIHSSDMMDSASFSWTGRRMLNWINDGGYPSFLVDHYPFPDLPRLDFFPAELPLYTHERLLMYEPAKAEVTDVTWDASTRLITATVEATFYDTLSGDLRLNLFATLDSLSGIGTGWDQVNGANTHVGHPYYGLGDPIVGFQHRHVMMTALGAEFGKPGVIPSIVYPGSSYSTTFSFTLPHIFWGATDQTDSITPELVNLIAAVQRYDAADIRNRKVLNTLERELILTVNAEETSVMGSFEVYPNPSQGELLLAVPPTALPQMVEVFDLHGRCIARQPATDWQPWTPIRLNTEGWPAGIYSVVLHQQNAAPISRNWVLHR
jgi:hypothetical protein